MFMTYLQEIVQLFRYEKMTYLVALKRYGYSYTRREGIWGSGCKAPVTLNIGTRWTWSVSGNGRFTP